MRLSEHRRRFSYHVADLLSFVEFDYVGYEMVLGEIGRTKYQQAEYVRLGKSRTMSSDHLESRAVDFVLYKIDDGRLIPVWAKEHWYPIAREWHRLDPDHNYWGYALWDFDTPHFGRKKRRLFKWEKDRMESIPVED